MSNKNMEIKPTKFSKICVFCGSTSGNKSTYTTAATELGKQLVSNNIGLVYGGGSIGLMGIIAKNIYNRGGHVIRVISKTLMRREITGRSIGEVKVVANMHQRKVEMAINSDTFIALPGGYGTLEELFEVITWAQLCIHNKPVGLLNVDGYYDYLLAFIDKAVEEEFISQRTRRLIISAPTARDLVIQLQEYCSNNETGAAKLNWEAEQTSDTSAT